MTDNHKQSLQVVLRNSEKSKLLTLVGYSEKSKLFYRGEVFRPSYKEDKHGRAIYYSDTLKVKSQKYAKNLVNPSIF